MKAYSDLEQSKKLAEILPIESADMRWQYIEEDNGQLQWFCFPKDFSINQHNTVSAWSLAALLEILPDVKLCHYNDKHFCQYIGLVDDFPKYSTLECDNPVDACYEMIIHLHELNLL